MSDASRHRLVLALLLLVAAVVFLLGINWGLPSRAVDPFLFGDEPVWPGAKIAQLAGDRSSGDAVGADVDRNPVVRTGSPIVLNQTDQQRAEIIQRYRLYTYQPDEMITMMALARMKPSQRDFDPKLYQYGGLWVYPVGALIKVFAHPEPDRAYYLEHPEQFGRFYVIARLYVVAFGIVGAWAVFWIARRLCGDLLTASFATLCYTFMPVVVNMAHEAKPHLPAAVLMLLATIAATRFVDTGRKRWWTLAAALCGAAAGMVLSAVVAMVVPVVMVMWRRGEKMGQRIVVLLGSLVIAADVYFLTNPYVLVHLLRDRAVLVSNLQNSQAMYRAPASVQGLWNAVTLIGVGTAPMIGIAGSLSIVGFLLSLSRGSTELAEVKRRVGDPIGWIIIAVSALVCMQFAMLATGKPAEYARFALLPDIALAIVGVVGASKICRSIGPRVVLLSMIFLGTAAYGASYVWHFLRDSVERTTRLIDANRLHELNERGATAMMLAAEPAPYSLPPVNLFKWKLALMPDDARGANFGRIALPVNGVWVRAADRIDPDRREQFWTRPRLTPTPMSWAAKPLEVIEVRQDARP